MDLGRDPELAQQAPALVQRLDVRVHRPDVLEPGARHRQQMVVHPLKMLADDVQAAMRHQVVDVGDPSGDRVLDRDHRQLGAALAHRGERILERVSAGSGVEVGDRPARQARCE